MLRVRSHYAPGTRDYSGGFREIRWDLSECNLRCLFCWSPASRPSETNDPARLFTAREIVEGTLKNLNDKSRTFIRFTGGEPTLQWSGISEALLKIRNAINPPRPPILFQTNGIEIGKGTVSLDMLSEDKDQYYLFEISLKGTNSEEFTLLTGKTAENYAHQLSGLERLMELSKKNSNIQVIAVLGVYHSSTGRPSKYAFANPHTGKLLFEDSNVWDPRFSALWQGASIKWVERLRMSPMGVWKSLLKRCGPDGAGVLQHFPEGAATNRYGLFPAKPNSAEYARQIVTRRFWI